MTQSNQRPSVSVLGLGNMGGAFARALLAAGCNVTVWNRSSTKSEPFVAAGAKIASSAAEAVASSPLTIVCLIDKASTAQFMQSKDAIAAVKGRTVVDVSTGSVAEARAAADRIGAAGAKYLDGGNLCYPRDIGKAESVMLFAGSTNAFNEHRSTLAVLAGSPRHVGEDPGAAATAYHALWSYYFGALTAFFEGAALSATAGMPITKFAELSAIMIAKLPEGLEDAAERISSGNMAGDQATIDAYIEGLIIVRDTFASAHVEHLTVDAFISYLGKTKAAGGGGKDIAALYGTILGASEEK
jgi:3-hydroxyisobutyrate dehydrogenase-like beta-hydroxyacid dehydrogenase